MKMLLLLTRSPRVINWAAGFLALATAQASPPLDWTFESAFPTHNDLHAIWAPAVDHVLVVGDGGVIMRWDGESWTSMVTPTDRALFDIHGTSANDVWAVGGNAYQADNDDQSVVLHFDGQSWHQVATPVDGFGQRLSLQRVWAVSPTEVYAIPDTYLSVFRWDGSQWEDMEVAYEITSEFLEGGFEDLRWVNGLGLVVVGTHGQIVLYDGADWTLEQKLETGGFSTNILTCIFALDQDHVYAGNNWGTVYRRNANGTWTDLEVGEGGFFGSGQNVAIMGNAANDLDFLVSRKVRHFTGAMPTDNTEFGNEVLGGWQAADRAADTCFIATYEGGVYAFDLNAKTMAPLTVRLGEGFNGRLNGSVALGASDLLLYGSGHYFTEAENFAVYDGTRIRNIDDLPPDMTDQASVDAAATRPDGVIAMMFDDYTTYRGGVYYWDGVNWQALPGAYTRNGDLAFSESGKLYLAEYGSLKRWDDLALNPVTLLTIPIEDTAEHGLSAVWAGADDFVFAGAIDGQIRRWNGAAWTSETTIADHEIWQILGDATDVYAIAFPKGSYRENGQLWRRANNGAWSRISLEQDLEIDPIALANGATGAHLAYATPGNYIGGGRTFVVKLDGATATPVVSGLSGQYETFAANGQGELFLVASSGRVFTNRPAPASRSIARVPLAGGAWADVGDSGISVVAGETSDASPCFVGWHDDGLPDNVPAPSIPTFNDEFWFVRADAAREDGPSYRFRFAYDPASMPPGFDPASLILLRFDGTQWTEVPSIVDLENDFVESLAPTGASHWAIGQGLGAGIIPNVELALDGNSATLSWPGGFDGVLVSSPDLSPGSWVLEEATPPLINGQCVVTVDYADPARFFQVVEATAPVASASD